MLKLTALLTLFATAAYAADPAADAPLAGQSVHVEIGEPVPFSGRLLSDAEHVKSEKQCQDDHDFRQSATAGGKVLLSSIALVAIVAGALAVGAAVSAGVAVAARRP